MGITSFQADQLIMKALIEVAEGVKDGPALGEVRAMLTMADSGVIADPAKLRQPTPHPKAPSAHEPLTNARIDGREKATTAPRPRPWPGTRRWFEEREHQ